jgi:hypothetical protein
MADQVAHEDIRDVIVDLHGSGPCYTDEYYSKE